MFKCISCGELSKEHPPPVSLTSHFLALTRSSSGFGLRCLLYRRCLDFSGTKLHVLYHFLCKVNDHSILALDTNLNGLQRSSLSSFVYIGFSSTSSTL